MQGSIYKKKEAFKQQIRKQNMNKLFGLKRLKPKLIESNNQALTIVTDGLKILQNQSSQNQVIIVLRSLKIAFQKYTFLTHQTLIKRCFKQVLWTLKNTFYHQSTKQVACELILVLSHFCTNIINFKQLPYDVLSSFNLKNIKSILEAIAHYLNSLDSMIDFDVSFFCHQKNILRLLLQIIINFRDKIQCFDYIKIPFLVCSIPFCYLAWKLFLNKNQNDFHHVLTFSVEKLQSSVIEQSQKDKSLKVFFKKPDTISKSYSSQVIQTYFPFSLLKLSTQIIKDVNYDVITSLQECLFLQIHDNQVEQNLVGVLNKMLFQTLSVLDEDLKNQCFNYIFSMKYTEKQNNGSLREIILLMSNNAVNSQQPDNTIFEAMYNASDFERSGFNKLFKLAQYLEDREDLIAQEYLFELVENYVVLNGYEKEIQDTLRRKKMLQKLGLIHESQTDIQETNMELEAIQNQRY